MTAAPEIRLGLPIIGFADEQAFLHWLSVTPRTAPGIWLKLVKKGAGVPGISKAAALDASPLATRAFAALKRADQYAILYRMNNLKTERGRAKAVAYIVLMLLNSQAGQPSRDIG